LYQTQWSKCQKQLTWQSTDRHVTPIGHIILIPSQPAFALFPSCCVLSEEQQIPILTQCLNLVNISMFHSEYSLLIIQVGVIHHSLAHSKWFPTKWVYIKIMQIDIFVVSEPVPCRLRKQISLELFFNMIVPLTFGRGNTHIKTKK
jgi:hypothetical protein